MVVTKEGERGEGWRRKVEKKADRRGYPCTAALGTRSSSVPALRPFRKIVSAILKSKWHKSLSPASIVPIPPLSAFISFEISAASRHTPVRIAQRFKGDMIAAMDLY